MGGQGKVVIAPIKVSRFFYPSSTTWPENETLWFEDIGVSFDLKDVDNSLRNCLIWFLSPPLSQYWPRESELVEAMFAYFIAI